MSIRILHTADLHLGAPLTAFGEWARERQRDFEKTFDRIVNLAIKREVDCLLVAGDLFDATVVGAEVVGRVQAGFARLIARRVAVVLIPGTHDHVVAAQSVYHRYVFPDVAVLMDEVVDEPLCLTIKGEPVFFYGLAFRRGNSSEALATMVRRSTQGFHIGLLHGSLRGSPEWTMRHKDFPFTPEELAALDLDYIALGHYHDFAAIEHDGKLVACYPGSPEGKRFGENGERYVVLAEIEQGKVALEKVTVQSRKLQELQVDASLFADTATLVENLRRISGGDAVARIRLTGVLEEPLDLDYLRGALQGSFAWLDLMDETDLFDSNYIHRIRHEDSIRGLFVRKLQERSAQATNQAERDLCREALKLAFKRFAGRLS